MRSVPSQEADPPRLVGGDTFSLAQYQHFRLHTWLYFHIDFGVHVRSRFQHGGAALPPPPLGGVLGGDTFSPCLLLGGAARHQLKRKKWKKKKKLKEKDKRKKNEKYEKNMSRSFYLDGWSVPRRALGNARF